MSSYGFEYLASFVDDLFNIFQMTDKPGQWIN